MSIITFIGQVLSERGKFLVGADIGADFPTHERKADVTCMRKGKHDVKRYCSVLDYYDLVECFRRQIAQRRKILKIKVFHTLEECERSYVDFDGRKLCFVLQVVEWKSLPM